VRWETRYASSDEDCEHPARLDRCKTCPKLAGPEAFVLDVSPFALPVARTGVKFGDHIEASRTKIQRCMKAGGTLGIDLRGLAPNFALKVFDPKWKQAVPAGLFAPVQWKKCGASSFAGWQVCVVYTSASVHVLLGNCGVGANTCMRSG